MDEVSAQQWVRLQGGAVLADEGRAA